MTLKLNKNLKNIAVITGWTVTIASIILQRLYQSPLLIAQDYVLIFVVSMLAATILVDTRTVIQGWVGSTLAAIALMFICLTLPGITDKVVSDFLLGFLYAGAVTMIFRAVFPAAIIVCFLGAIVGGIIGESLRQYCR
jgi:hypothetical protein